MSFRDYEPVDLANAGFKIHQLESLEKDNIENAFAGYVDEVLGKINDGKEATVYLCRGGASTTAPLLAAKVFKARNFRNFSNDHSYRNFSKHKDRRMAKAMRGRSRKGEKAFHQDWVKSEWQNLTRLHEAGIRVPEPVALFPDGVLMEFIGNDAGPAPRLVNCKLTNQAAHTTASLLMRDIEKMLSIHMVHGDLSAYNILYHNDQPVIIDVPQAMDLRTTPDAWSIMHRDLGNLENCFRRLGTDISFMQLLDNY